MKKGSHSEAMGQGTSDSFQVFIQDSFKHESVHIFVFIPLLRMRGKNGEWGKRDDTEQATIQPRTLWLHGVQLSPRLQGVTSYYCIKMYNTQK